MGLPTTRKQRRFEVDSSGGIALMEGMHESKVSGRRVNVVGDFFAIRRLSKPRFAWLISAAVAGALAAGCSGLANREETFEPRTVNFDAGGVGRLPPDFSTALTGGGIPVSWVVRDVPIGPDGGAVLVQESSDDTSYRFPLCIYEKTIARDVAVEVKYKAISGKVDQAGGIVLRLQSRELLHCPGKRAGGQH